MPPETGTSTRAASPRPHIGYAAQLEQFAPAEAVGKKPGHLIQGPETEEYLVDEIVDA